MTNSLPCPRCLSRTRFAPRSTKIWAAPATSRRRRPSPRRPSARAVIAAREDGVVAGLRAGARSLCANRRGDHVRAMRRRRRACRKGRDRRADRRFRARRFFRPSASRSIFLGRLSGVATLTARFASKIAHTKARVCDTRKTTPLLRAFEKYAVRCGGGVNHRFGLDDAILIKDNHVAVAGGVTTALRAAKRF